MAEPIWLSAGRLPLCGIMERAISPQDFQLGFDPGALAPGYHVLALQANGGRAV